MIKIIIVFGVHSVLSIIYNNVYKILKIYYCKDKNNIFIKKILFKLKFSNINLKKKSKKYIDLLTNFKNNQCIALKMIFKFNIYNFYKILSYKKNYLTFLIINKLFDINNIGNILRNCSLFRCNLVIIFNKKKILNSQLFKISSGSITPFIFLKNIKKFLILLKKNKFKIICLKQDNSQNSYNFKINFKNICFLFGNENYFFNKDLLSCLCDFKLFIKTLGNIKSLNVVSSINILLYERFNQINSEWTGIEPVISGVTSQYFNH